jgi:hypothetical protein
LAQLNEKVAATRPYQPINRGSGIGLSTGVSAQEEEAARPANPRDSGSFGLSRHVIEGSSCVS